MSKWNNKYLQGLVVGILVTMTIYQWIEMNAVLEELEIRTNEMVADYNILKANNEEWKTAHNTLTTNYNTLKANNEEWKTAYDTLKEQNDWYKAILIGTYGWKEAN